MDPSAEKPNQLTPPSSAPRTIEQVPRTVSVTAGASVLTDIGDNVITERAEHIRYSNDETMIWQETPSLALLAPRAVRYAIWLIVFFAVCGIANGVLSRNPAARFLLEHNGIRVSSSTSGSARHAARRLKNGHRASADDAAAASTDQAAPAADADSSDTAEPRGLTLNRIFFLVKCGFAGLLAILFLAYLFKLKTTKYSASSQRLIVEEGALHAVNRPYELHQLGDAVILKPMFLRLFNVSNLEITKPHIVLYGLRNAEYVRDILRQGGQIEASRVDKIRWR